MKQHFHSSLQTGSLWMYKGFPHKNRTIEESFLFVACLQLVPFVMCLKLVPFVLFDAYASIYLKKLRRRYSILSWCSASTIAIGYCMDCQTASLRKFRVMNASTRLVCNAPRFWHITPIMRDLHWLLIRVRINFKVLLLTFKALHGLAPQYLRSLTSIKTSCYNLRGF